MPQRPSKTGVDAPAQIDAQDRSVDTRVPRRATPTQEEACLRTLEMMKEPFHKKVAEGLAK